MAARLSSEARDSFFQPLFAHTGPAYETAGVSGPDKRLAAAWFGSAIVTSVEWVPTGPGVTPTHSAGRWNPCIAWDREVHRATTT